MTKELELLAERLENLSSRLSGQVTDSGADFAWLIIYNYAIEIEQINHTLATLAKTQGGGKEFRACVCHTDSDKRLCLHKNDCCVVEAQSTLIAQQKSTEGEKSAWTRHDRIEFALRDAGFDPAEAAAITARVEADSAAPGGDVETIIQRVIDELREEEHERRQEDRYAGIFPDAETADQLATWANQLVLAKWRLSEDAALSTHAPGGDVEQRAIELLALAERGPANEYGTVHRRIAHQAIIAALSAPKLVGVIGSEELIAGLADTFNGDDLQLLASARALLDLDKSGSLVPHGIGGHARGIIETFIVRMAYAPQAAPVPVEGDAVAWRSKTQAPWMNSYAWSFTTNYGDVGPDHEPLYTHPHEQPAVELDGWISDPDSIPKKIINACRDAILIEFGNNGTDGYYKRILARVFVALIDGAKAGRAEGEEARPERTGTVSDIPDDELLRRGLYNVIRRNKRKVPAWSKASDIFGLGSTYAAQLCKRFNRDPDTGKPIATPAAAPERDGGEL